MPAWVVLSPAARADDWGLTRPDAAKKKPAKPARPRGQAPGAQPDPSEAAHAAATQRERYLRLLLGNPEDGAALQRLLALYRERDGNLDGLSRELAGRPDPDAATWLLLGKVELERGQRDHAKAAFARAAELDPRALGPTLAQAALARSAGNLAAADALLTAALERVSERRARGELLRELGELALERKDYAAAERHYAARAKALGGGVFESTELARALAGKGEPARAAEAYARAIEALHGDLRAVAPLWLERARVELAAGQLELAAQSLQRARSLAVAGTGLRADCDELLVTLHRNAGTLGQLATELAAERGASFEQLALLARVYEELGDQGQALSALRAALARKPTSTELRERVIAVLTQRGDLRAAIEEYRVLVRHAPREPRYVIELARSLLESGARAEALRMLDATAQRFPSDARIARSLLDLYARWGEQARATRMLEHLSRIEPNDPAHWVALGEQRLEQGDEAGALAAWQRILSGGGDPAEAHAQLGATLLDHDMPERALAEYDAALKLDPEGLPQLRGSAETLERMQRLGEAAERWLGVLELTEDRSLRREARRRVVRLWAGTGDLTRKRAELERAFLSAATPDVEAGRFLAESYRALATGRRRALGDVQLLADAEKVLLRLVELVPGDVESLLALERVRVQRGDLSGAIAALERLLAADPKNAQGYLARMAEHALALYRDDEALGYAERAVALAPNDARAYLRLGDLYRARQSADRAIEAYERAVALDPNAFATQLELAELQLSHGQLDAAGGSLRRVLRACPDDELVQRAARALLQLELRGGRLPEVEQTLLPLALG
ncbi:MAG TPA: tetratricopeptide repeat protein, partial [Polyangiales bacterium]|nr:tetratricopeptide repeat protein [Polyangiales bacterium]